MNSRSIWQQFKDFLVVNSLFALILAAPSVASPTNPGTSATLDDVRDTNYPIPTGAYYVSPNGKDTNSGKDAGSPWPVEKAIASAPKGSTIVFRGGIYHNVNTEIGKKLTLQAYPHEKALLKGSIEVSDWSNEGDGIWRKDKWNYSFPPQVNDKFINPNSPMAGYRDMVYVNGVALKQVRRKAEVVAGTFYVDRANKDLYVGYSEELRTKTVEATVWREAFFIEKAGSSDSSNTVVKGLGFAHYADQAIRVAAPKVKLEDNTFVWNGEMGVQLMSEYDKVLSGVSTYAVVINNTFSYNGRKGLGGSDVDCLVLKNNTISYNNYERFALNYDAAGVKLIHTNWTNCQQSPNPKAAIRNNVVEHNFATGIWIDSSGTNAPIVYNTVRNNQSIGIQMELSHKAIIAANVVYDNGAGIMIADSSSARVYNNTLSMNNKHIIVKDGERKNTNAEEIAAGNLWVTQDNVLKNNIFSNTKNKISSNTTTDDVHFDGSECQQSEQAKMVAASNYNAYYRTSSSKPPIVIEWSAGAGECPDPPSDTYLDTYNSIAAFSSATGFEQNALAIDNVATNPFFDEANRNYRLKTGSPAIGRGEPLPQNIANAIGLPAGVKVDLGAIQATQY